MDTFDFIDQRRVREIFDQFGPGLRAIFMYIDKFNIKGFEAVARKVDPWLLSFTATRVIPRLLRRNYTFGRKETKQFAKCTPPVCNPCESSRKKLLNSNIFLFANEILKKMTRNIKKLVDLKIWMAAILAPWLRLSSAKILHSISFIIQFEKWRVLCTRLTKRDVKL